MSQKLTQSDFEALSAYFDGELSPAEAQQVRRRIENDADWADAWAELRRLDDVLDAWEPCVAPDRLPERILAAVQCPLSQDEYERLSAWFDGELDEQQAAEVSQLVVDDPTWTAAHEELVAMDAAMDAWEVPSAPAELPERIIRAAESDPASQPYRILRIASWLVPVATAAAIAIAATLAYNNESGDPLRNPDNGTALNNTRENDIETASDDAALEKVPEEDRFVVSNLDFFQNMDVLENLDTIRELEALDAGETGS
ncbi:MAG: anti-sigma factor family protein [Phycisphaerae bacterium]